MKIVVLSPHRDDAAFSLGLAIDAWLHAGQAVQVVNCFTRSTYAPFAEFEMIHSNDRMLRVSALRLREDERWARMYSAKLSLLDLRLKDAPLRLRCSVSEVCGLAVDAGDKAMTKIPKALAEARGNAFVLPLALGGHVDHVTARSAALAGLPSDVPIAFYEDLPYATRPGVAAKLAEAAQAIDVRLTPVFASAPADVNDAVERKRRMALVYDSQIDDEGTREIAEFSRQYEGRERLWGNPAWKALRSGDFASADGGPGE